MDLLSCAAALTISDTSENWIVANLKMKIPRRLTSPKNVQGAMLRLTQSDLHGRAAIRLAKDIILNAIRLESPGW